MITPYYDDGTVVLYLGKIERILLDLPDASVDAVVTDPPYGLEFMGKEWDTFGRGEAASNATAGTSSPGIGDRELEWPSFLGGINPRCSACGKSQRGGSPCRCAAPQFTDERGPRLRAFQQWCEVWAHECLRVLKPGGHLLAFGGTRTYHRMVCAIEDAGFEIRDSIHWIYGSGFPKSLDVGKAIDKAAGAEREVVGEKRRPDGATYSSSHGERSGRRSGIAGTPVAVARSSELLTAPATEDAGRWDGWGTALKPAHEPIVLARKPLAGTVAANVLTHGTGALNIDGCRIAARGRPLIVSPPKVGADPGAFRTQGGFEVGTTDAGRWPTNVVFTHAPNCDVYDEGDGDIRVEGSCVPGCPVAELDTQSGVLTSGANPVRRGSDKFRDAYGAFAGQEECVPARGADRGGASRFFPVFRYEAKAPASERPKLPDGTAWPTVKPLALMRWLVRLITPPGGTVLDCFAGSGTTGEACVIEGFRCVLVDQDPQAAELIKARLGKPIQPSLGFDEEIA